MKLYHTLLSKWYASLADSLEEDYVYSVEGSPVYLRYWSRFVRHKELARR